MPAFLAASPGVKLLGVDISKQLTSTLKGLPLIGGLLAKNTKDKNPGRIEWNKDLETKAMAGDSAAYTQLKARSQPGAIPYDTWKDAAARLANVEAYRGSPTIPSTLPPPATKPWSSGDDPFGFGPGGPTSVLPPAIKDGVEKVAAAVGTTSNTVTWIALAIGLVVVVKSFRS